MSAIGLVSATTVGYWASELPTHVFKEWVGRLGISFFFYLVG